jgi:hypothetical protein
MTFVRERETTTVGTRAAGSEQLTGGAGQHNDRRPGAESLFFINVPFGNPSMSRP